MNLLAVERIKLVTTRSPWWCALIILAITIGFAALLVGAAGNEIAVSDTQAGHSLGMSVLMVLAALSVTTEYRFGTIRTTFQAIPHRGAALLAKTVVVATLALIIGEVSAFGAWGAAKVLKPTADLALNSSADWINVAGVGVLFALAAVIAVAVGILLRHSAGAIALLLVYTLLVESLVTLIPNIGPDIHRWMPFTVAEKFLAGGGTADSGFGPKGEQFAAATLSPGWSLAYFAAVAVGLLAIAITVAKKRDA